MLRAVGVGAAVGLAGCSGGPGGGAQPTPTEEPTPTPAQTPTSTPTPAPEGQTHTVTMHMEPSNGGMAFYFDPVAVAIQPGDTVEWELVSGQHTATAFPARIPEGAEPFDTGLLTEAGTTASVTFETEGTYDYYCEPHRGLQMVGRIVVGVAGGPGNEGSPPEGMLPAGFDVQEAGAVSFAEWSAIEGFTYGSWFRGVDAFDGTEDETGDETKTIMVGAQGNGGPFAFDPTAILVDAGTKITWEWVAGTHNVVAVDGSFRSGDPVEGGTYTYTFDEPGVYTYFCEPHRGLGMKGAVVVQ
ncbi:halocyanin domain-containing protein [Natronomonas sp. EA1]|uniref:halocyanin domain-containing protein n=1 Tax=Natronomonas sp. EA1 TaxID=3421655 RepID=UPI003EB7D4C6